MARSAKSPKNTVPKKPRPSKKKGQPNNAVSVQVGRDIKDSNVIVGDHNQVSTTTNINRTRNITNIIKNARPRDFILYTSLFLIALAGIFYLFWYTNLRYDRAISSGQLNVLVVPFVEEKPWGYVNSDRGWSIAQIFADNIERSFEGSGVKTSITILGPSEKVPQIIAFSEKQLGRSVETISEKINGQIVIYGVISAEEYGESLVHVRFYISPSNFGETQELISDSMMGELSFGSFRITSDTAGSTDLTAHNEELRDRLEIFSHLINFLGAYLGEEFDLAQTYFEKVIDEKLWGNKSGLEVVYLAGGNMKIRHARELMTGGDVDAVLQALDQANEYFDQANGFSTSNGLGDYARAYLGHAGVESLYAIVEARIKKDLSLINTSHLEEASANLDLAENAKNQPETADIEVKVNYIKAQVSLSYYAKTRNVFDHDEAIKLYGKIISEYSEGRNKRIGEFAALSYSGLGYIAMEDKDYELSIKDFLAAVNITNNPSLKVQCLTNIGDAYFKLKQYDEALKYYLDVLERNQDLKNALSQDKIEEIQDRIDAIKGDASF